MTDLQKASLWKRISAALFDGILLGIVVVGAAAILSGVFGYDGYVQQLGEAYAKYGQQYGVEIPLEQSAYDALSETAQENYRAAMDAINADPAAVRSYNMTYQLPLLIVTLSVLFGVLLFEFLFPLIFGNGQTLGKKIFGVALMRVDGIKVTGVQNFVRAVLGKYAVELMIPIFVCLNLYLNGSVNLIMLALLALMVISQFICLIATRTGSLLHDVMACTVAVDLASQMIFDSKEEQLDYIKKIHAQNVENSTY